MEKEADVRYCFVAEWYDSHAELTRKYHLFYYQNDSSIEMFDIKNKRTFLKRTPYPLISKEQIYLGSTITVYARPLKLSQYGDDYTKHLLESANERFVIAITDSDSTRLGEMLSLWSDAGFKLLHAMKTDRLADFDNQICYLFEFSKVNGFKQANEIIQKNPFIKAVSLSNAKSTVHSILPLHRSIPRSPNVTNKGTLCIIKPHALSLAGNIVHDIIENGFEIQNLSSFHLLAAEAEEFLEVYNGILPDYKQMVHELISGTLLALHLTSKGNADKSVKAFRDLVGPYDSEIAKHTAPSSIRAKYGHDKVKNAVHCTDLPEDGELEIQYFFEILSKK